MTESDVKLFLYLFLLLFSQISGFSLKSVRNYDQLKSLRYSKYYNTDKRNEVSSSVYKTANRYQCEFNPIKDPETIVYGTKSWVFPEQTINLTLSYPSTNEGKDNQSKKSQYIITGFNVILFVDTPETQGFITSGGILKDSITLMFSCKNVTMLVYEFWLFGVRTDTPVVQDLLISNDPLMQDLC